MHRNENVVAATKLPSPAALEVIILTTSSAASDENIRIVASVHDQYGNTVTSNHLMPMLAADVVIATTRATVSDQRVATAPSSPNHRFFALSCCYKYSNRFHHSRNYINQSSNIWYGGKQSINKSKLLCSMSRRRNTTILWPCLDVPNCVEIPYVLPLPQMLVILSCRSAEWAVSIHGPSFPGIGIPTLKIRRSRDRLIFNMGIPLLVRRHIHIEMAPSLISLPCFAGRSKMIGCIASIGRQDIVQVLLVVSLCRKGRTCL